MTRWWRVELTPSGKVHSVTECPAPSASGNRVIYLQASSLEEVYKIVRRKYDREQKAKRVAANKARGKCWCGRERDDENYERCARCRESGRRENAKRRGETPKPTCKVTVPEPKLPPEFAEERPPTPVARFNRPELSFRERIRLETLLEVMEWWLRSPNNRAFSGLLREEILKLGVITAPGRTA